MVAGASSPPPRQWLILRLLGLAVLLPVFVWRSVLGVTAYQPVRPWISDERRARVIGWALIGGAIIGGLPMLWLYAAFTPRADEWLVALLIVALGLTAVCFWLGYGKGPSSDLDGVLVGEEPDDGATPREKAIILRGLTACSLAWVGALIYWTGGPAVSPFTIYGVIAVILGQFLSSTAETPFAMMLLGCAVFGWLTYATPYAHGLLGQPSLRDPTLAPQEFATWRYLMTCLGLIVSVGINRRTTRSSLTLPSRG